MHRLVQFTKSKLFVYIYGPEHFYMLKSLVRRGLFFALFYMHSSHNVDLFTQA